MKTKTFTTLALALAFSGCAWAEDVYSSNIVGYQKVALQPGFNFVAPQFVAIGGDSIDLQSIRLNVADEDATGGDNIQILDEGGATITQYYWLPADWFGGEKSGWIDDETGDLVDLTLDNGLGILVDSTGEATVTVSGEVPTANAEIVTVQGFNWIGNSTPKAIDIQDIQIDVSDENATGGDNIQILDDGGATIAQYYWLPADWFGGEKSGWVDDETGNLAEISLEPGTGVLFDSVDEGTVVTVPSAIQ